jgi:hypothetical protein
LPFWHDDEDASVSVSELMKTFTTVEGYHDLRKLVEWYEDPLLSSSCHERFYRTLASYKMAALGEMFYPRYLEGNCDDPLNSVREERLPALAQQAIRVIDGEEPL